VNFHPDFWIKNLAKVVSSYLVVCDRSVDVNAVGALATDETLNVDFVAINDVWDDENAKSQEKRNIFLFHFSESQ
jgi:hypothetical protein